MLFSRKDKRSEQGELCSDLLLYCSRIDAAAFGPALKAKPKPDAVGSIRRGGAAAQARSDVSGGNNSDIFVFLSSLAR